MTNNNQKGFSAVEILLVIMVVAILVLAGWLFYNRQKDSTDTTQTTQQSEQAAPQVNSADDLKSAEDYLNQSDIDQQLDTGEIDAALSEQ